MFEEYSCENPPFQSTLIRLLLSHNLMMKKHAEADEIEKQKQNCRRFVVSNEKCE